MAFSAVLVAARAEAKQVEIGLDGAGDLLEGTEQVDALGDLRIGDAIRVRIDPGVRSRLVDHPDIPNEAPDRLDAGSSGLAIVHPPEGSPAVGGPLTVFLVNEQRTPARVWLQDGGGHQVATARATVVGEEASIRILGRAPEKCSAAGLPCALLVATLLVPAGFGGTIQAKEELPATTGARTTTTAVGAVATPRSLTPGTRAYRLYLTDASGRTSHDLTAERTGEMIATSGKLATPGDLVIEIVEIVGGSERRVRRFTAQVSELFSELRFQAVIFATQHLPGSPGTASFRATASVGAIINWNHNYSRIGTGACWAWRLVPGVSVGLAPAPGRDGDAGLNALFGLNFFMAPAVSVSVGLRFLVDDPTVFIIGQNLWAGIGIDVPLLAELVAGRQNVAALARF